MDISNADKEVLALQQKLFIEKTKNFELLKDIMYVTFSFHKRFDFTRNF